MKPALILMLTCLLSACGLRSGSTASPDIPPSLTQPCAKAVSVPERDLTRGEVETLWLTDRRALAACRSRHSGLVAAIR